MKSRQFFGFASAFALLFLSTIISASAQTNGSFEQGINPGGFTTVFAGQTNISGWSVDFGSVDYIGNYWQASEGARSVDMNGQNQAGQISQSLATTAGWTYEVTFDMSGNPDGGPAKKFMSVSADKRSTVIYLYTTGSNTRADMQWESNVYYFTANSSTTVLSFTSETAGFFGPALDSVKVRLVAEN